ncbi:hypothetical protein Tco_0368392 [Tanacetum coccineum]
MVGALMYLTTSRPNIVHATCYCARYQARPTEKHLKKVKRIFWYLKNTIHMGLWYLKDTGFKLTAFLYSDHAGCLDTRKSTSGGIQFLEGDKLLSWSSKKQDCTSMSTAEAEYVSLSACCSIPINRGLIQAIPTSLPPQPIGEATKASNLQRIPPGVQGRSHFTYFLYLIVGPHGTGGTNIDVAASFQQNMIHYHMLTLKALKVKHSASRLLLLNKNVFGQKAQANVIFSDFENHELPQCH